MSESSVTGSASIADSADGATTQGASISAGHLLVHSLQALGATRCFGVPGESYLDVLDGLHDTQGQLDFILCRNEGGAAFMAEAHGKLSGIPGVCMVTRGPGATNASIGVHTAMQNSSPMLLLIGQIATTDKDREVFQEVDYRAFFAPLAKWVTEITDAHRIPELLSRAWSTALSGRPGPVVVALPENMLSAQTPAVTVRPVRIPEPSPSAADIDELCAMLNNAKKPLLLVGGGAWQSSGRDALRQFVENNDLPVAAAFRFQDIVDNHSESYVGEAGVGMSPALRDIIADADLILAIGLRFDEMTTGAYQLLTPPYTQAKLIHVHPSDRELGKIYTADLPIHAGPNASAQALATVALSGQWAQWRQQARQAYIDYFNAPAQPGPVDMVAVCEYLQTCLPENCIITSGAGNFSLWPNKFLRYGENQRLLTPQSGAMGYGVPAAIAAKVAHPDRLVVCFAGDGDFQMNGQELGTAMQAGAQPIILILNNASYGTIRMHQERHYPDRVSATDLQNPDFVALAKAYGFYAQRIERTEQFADAFKRATESETGAVLELMISVEAITPKQTLSQITQAAKLHQQESQ